MHGQRDARLNLDLHAMTEAPESQTHVVDRVRCVLRHGGQSYRGRPKKRAPTGDSPAEAQVGHAVEGARNPSLNYRSGDEQSEALHSGIAVRS